MDRLLRDIRDFTRASLGHEGPASEIDAGLVLEKLTNLRAAIDESQAEVTSEPLPIVGMHEFQLEQVFQNLIGNALRYRSKAPPRIHVKAEREGNLWRFSIRDNGIGIAPEYQTQVFGLFKRLHTNSEYPGTGMGLAICQRIVERVGGRISVESEVGKGSESSLRCPRHPGSDRASAAMLQGFEHRQALKQVM